MAQKEKAKIKEAKKQYQSFYGETLQAVMHTRFATSSGPTCSANLLYSNSLKRTANHSIARYQKDPRNP